MGYDAESCSGILNLKAEEMNDALHFDVNEKFASQILNGLEDPAEVLA